MEDAAAGSKSGAPLRDRMLVTLTRDGDGNHLNQAGSGDLAAALASLDIGIGPVNTISKLLAKVVAQRVITITLTLEPTHADRVEITMMVTDWEGRAVEATRATAAVPRRVGDDGKKTDDPAEAYLSLEPELTGCLTFALARAWRAGQMWPPKIATTTSPPAMSPTSRVCASLRVTIAHGPAFPTSRRCTTIRTTDSRH